jgi:ketol-acid reductoisomerase
MQQSFTAIDQGNQVDEELFDNFMNNNIHQVLAVCAEMRPSVDIALVG